MRFRTMSNAAVHVLWAALAGCYAQVEDEDVSYAQASVCGTPSSCAANNAPLTFDSNFIPMITVDVGDSGLLTNSQSKQGPVTFTGSLLLNQTVVTMTTPADGNFNGLSTVDLRAALNNDPCTQVSPNCRSLATFDSARDGVAQKRLVLKGSGANLLEIAGPSKKLSVYVRATGNAPAAASWNGDLELSLTIKARGSFP